MNTTNIYILIDPRDDKVRYVGKANNVKERFKNHLNRARKNSLHKLSWFNQLKNLNLKPIVFTIDIVPIEEWHFWEKYWIQQFKVWGFDLINYKVGGEGLTSGNQTSFKKGMITWNKGKKGVYSQDFINNLNKIVICPHCNKEGGYMGMNRWHFNNCKLNNK